MKHIKPLKKLNFGFCIRDNAITVATDKFTICLGKVESEPYIEMIEQADFNFLHNVNEHALRASYKAILKDIINNL